MTALSMWPVLLPEPADHAITVHAAAVELEQAASLLRELAQVGRTTDSDAKRVIRATQAFREATG
jgi:hypothetical protein